MKCARCGGWRNGKHNGLCCDCSEAVEREVHHGNEPADHSAGSEAATAARGLATPEVYDREHNTDSALCWCGPTRDPIYPLVIIHRRPVES